MKVLTESNCVLSQLSVLPPDCSLHMLSVSPAEQKEEEEEEKEAETHPDKSVSVSAAPLSAVCLPACRSHTDTSVQLSPQTPTDTPPPLPTTPLPDDYYEEAVPLDPGSTPQYFTTNMSSCVPNSC